MRIYRQVIQKGKGRFSSWESPKLNSYHLQCCDCGLVHDIQFKVLVKGGKQLDGRTCQVQIRFRRNEKSTLQVRRSRRIKVRKV